ncbi:MAG: hypothetical protein HPY44_14530 [Armatimonadetes bacterium]|nr:hypothetical protein [Armatimonadota bacterium]
MTGREIAYATLSREDVPYPCMTSGFVTNSAYYTRVTGRDYWADPQGVFVEFVKTVGANLIIQWYFPGEAQRKLECGEIIHETRQHEQAGFRTPEDVLASLRDLPDDDAVRAGFDVDRAAQDYKAGIAAHQQLLGESALVIGHFGQADFMGGYNRWGYENYLAAAALEPETMRRFYHCSALHGRMLNEAIVVACREYGVPPFTYTGQDICGANGPLMSPAMLRQIYFPELKWCLEPLVDAGIDIIWHCDGNIMPILDDLLDLGITGLQGFEEEHGVGYAEMVKLKDPHGRPMIIIGCVSVTSTLPHGTVDDVRAAVERSFTLAGKGRGFVLSPTSSILPETPLENIDALFQHGYEFGRRFLGG